MDDVNPKIPDEESDTNLLVEPDLRIPCTNHSSLDKILEVAVQHFSKVAESLPIEKRDHIKTRFAEMFREIVHQNVSIRGLPWSTSGALISPSLQEEQVVATDDALHSLLAKSIEELAAKRRRSSLEVARIYEMQLKHQRQNLKKADVAVDLPPCNYPLPKPLTTQQHEELADILAGFNKSREKMNSLEGDILQLQVNVEAAKCLSHDDTGYSSS